MIFAYENKLVDYTLSAASYSSLFPINNIFDKRTDKKWVGDNTNVNQRIVIDALAAVEHDIVVVLSHNLALGVQTIKIQANTTNVWTSPSYTKTLTVKDFIFGLIDTGGTAYRYWSLYIEGCSAGTPPEIGFAFLGDYIDFQDAAKIYPINNKNISSSSKSEKGTLFGYKGNYTFKKFKLVWDWLESADLTEFKTFWDYVEKALPFIIIWSATTDYPLVPNLYCNFPNDFTNDNVIDFENMSLSVDVEECK